MSVIMLMMVAVFAYFSAAVTAMIAGMRMVLGLFVTLPLVMVLMF